MLLSPVCDHLYSVTIALLMTMPRSFFFLTVFQVRVSDTLYKRPLVHKRRATVSVFPHSSGNFRYRLYLPVDYPAFEPVGVVLRATTMKNARDGRIRKDERVEEDKQHIRVKKVKDTSYSPTKTRSAPSQTARKHAMANSSKKYVFVKRTYDSSEPDGSDESALPFRSYPEPIPS